MFPSLPITATTTTRQLLLPRDTRPPLPRQRLPLALLLELQVLHLVLALSSRPRLQVRYLPTLQPLLVLGVLPESVESQVAPLLPVQWQQRTSPLIPAPLWHLSLEHMVRLSPSQEIVVITQLLEFHHQAQLPLVRQFQQWRSPHQACQLLVARWSLPQLLPVQLVVLLQMAS